jgi:hypothetical protein
MTPRQFFDQVVRPNVAEFHADDDDMRHAYNAVAAVDALAAHIYVWCTGNATAEVTGLKDDSHYRVKLAAAHDVFRLLRDIAKAQKHVRLTKGTPAIPGAEQISTRAVGFGEAIEDLDGRGLKRADRPTTGSIATAIYFVPSLCAIKSSARTHELLTDARERKAMTHPARAANSSSFAISFCQLSPAVRLVSLKTWNPAPSSAAR